MAAAKKRIGPITLRFLLMTGYLFLFATQVNYRYYSIANFFVYGSITVSATGHSSSASPLRKTDRPTVCRIYRKASKNANHLVVDKRFHGVDGVKVGAVFYQPVLSYREIERKYGILLQVYSSSDLPTNSLRGPPSA